MNINLYASTTASLAGMLIYAPMGNCSNMKFNGNAATKLKGTVFMPAGPIVYNGNGNLNPDNWDATHPPQVGIMQ